MNVGVAMADVFAMHGVQRCYTVPGESFIPLLSAVDAHPSIRLVSTRHESGASFMADADARVTGRAAVTMATRGPGACNLSIGVHTAHEGSMPMLVVLGDVETEHTYRGAFQEVDLAAMYAPITKATIRAVRGARLADLSDHGLRIATAGRPGPVTLTIPQDLLDEEVAASSPPVPPEPRPAVPERATLERVAAMLAAAASPVVVAGAGCLSCTDELAELVRRYDLGVYSAFRRQDTFDNSDPRYLGHLGLGAPPSTLEAIAAADLVLVLGSRLGEITTQRFTVPGPGARVVQVDVSAESIATGRRAHLSIVADVPATIRALLGVEAPQLPARDWSSRREAYVRSATVPPPRSGTGTDPVSVIGAMCRTLPPDTLVASDAGNFAAALHRYWSYTVPGSQLAPTNGAMGYAVPAAVGGKLAAPDRHVVGVVGDGGFLMTGQEIETAVRTGADVTIIVMRNGMHGTIAMHQAQRGASLSGIDIGDVDPCRYAEALGAVGVRADDADGLADILAQAKRDGGVTVVDVPTDPDLISPTARLSEMVARTA